MPISRAIPRSGACGWRWRSSNSSAPSSRYSAFIPLIPSASKCRRFSVIHALETAWRFLRRGTAAAGRGKRYGLLLYIYAFATVAILIVAFIALAGRAPPLRMMYLLSMGGAGMVALVSQILARLHRRRRNRDK